MAVVGHLVGREGDSARRCSTSSWWSDCGFSASVNWRTQSVRLRRLDFLLQHRAKCHHRQRQLGDGRPRSSAARLALRPTTWWFASSSDIDALDQIIQGEPTVLIQDGRIVREALAKELVTESELMSHPPPPEISPAWTRSTGASSSSAARSPSRSKNPRQGDLNHCKELIAKLDHLSRQIEDLKDQVRPVLIRMRPASSHASLVARNAEHQPRD